MRGVKLSSNASLSGLRRHVQTTPCPLWTTRITAAVPMQKQLSTIERRHIPEQAGVSTSGRLVLDGRHAGIAPATPLVAFELVQGALVRWSNVVPTARPPPTCVLVHGILGSRRNMLSLAQRIVRAYSSWQVLLVDLRCHGESALVQQQGHLLPQASRRQQQHCLEGAAADILALLRHLKLFPEVLIGHSFGGKVVMSMADQFGRIGPRLPRPVQVWVLDALPGAAHEAAPGDVQHRRDHPADLIPKLQAVPLPIESRTALQQHLLGAGFSHKVAAWVASSLRPSQGDARQLQWSFDLEGVRQMYASYEDASFWPFLSAPTQGIRVDFVRAQHSSYAWSLADLDRLRVYGHRVHLLPNAGHWLHSDNPDGLMTILSSSFTRASFS